LFNLSTPELYDIACQHLRPSDFLTKPSTVSSTGAMVAFSGDRTGRSPKDKRIVVDEVTGGDVNWGEINIPVSK